MALVDVIIGYAKGAQGDVGPQGQIGPQGPEGPQGPLPTLVNNALATTPGVAALDAVMGKTLQDQITQTNSNLTALTTLVDYTTYISGLVYTDFVSLTTAYPCYKVGKRLHVGMILQINSSILSTTSAFTILQLAGNAIPAKTYCKTAMRYDSNGTAIQDLNIATTGLVQIAPRGDVSALKYLRIDFDIDTTTVG